jgi:hypothetical protein
MSDSDEDKDHNQHNMHQTSGYDQLSGCSSTATTNMVPITAASCSKPLKPEGTSCSLEQPLAWSKNILKQADFSWSNEPVSTLWSQLQKSTKKHNFCMSSVSKESFSVISSVSYFSDNLSACDIMSAAHSRKHMVCKLLVVIQPNIPFLGSFLIASLMHKNEYLCAALGGQYACVLLKDL